MRTPLVRPLAGLPFARTKPILTRSWHINPARTLKTTPTPDHKFAFAFDIDGVLLHGSRAIPAAKRALSLLNQHNIHYMFLTNGGGKSEHSRIQDLESKLGFRFSDKQICQAHTPFRVFATGERGGVYDLLTQDPAARKIGPDTPVLVVGGDEDKARKVAGQYGFKTVLMSYDFLLDKPEIWPFTSMHEMSKHARRVEGSPKIGAIFVFNDPRDWALDTQVIVDLMLSKEGELGTRSDRNGVEGKWQADGQPPLFFGCDDLFWANEYHLNRLGQGAFRKGLEGVWREITGGVELRSTIIGKPHEATYAFAEGILSHWLSGDIKGEREPLERVYMVGDNPESDIRGANEFKSKFGTEWQSLLVRTGVYKEEIHGEPKYKPTQIVDDVEHAVRWAMEREGCATDSHTQQ